MLHLKLSFIVKMIPTKQHSQISLQSIMFTMSHLWLGGMVPEQGGAKSAQRRELADDEHNYWQKRA